MTVTGYQPLDESGAMRFAEPFLLGSPEGAQEIGDGNLNLVFRVSSATDSVIVKQALPYLRVVGEGWPLTLDRSRIEAEATRLHARCAQGRVPELLHFDAEMCALVFEDLRQHVIWRQALIEGRHVEQVADQTGRYCAQVLVGTSDLGLDPGERKQLIARFINPELCAITESLVFTDPFIDAESNNYEPAAAALAASLRADRPLHAAAARLRFKFRTQGEALIHGDLHTGSIMVTDGDARIIDPEFAFYGPIGFDIGNVFANLAFARIAHEAKGNTAFTALIDRDAADFWSAFDDELAKLWPPTEPWRRQFVSSILSDAAGFAAVEMIRRIVGLAHVADIDSLPDGIRLAAQESVVQAARSLAVGEPVHSADELWARATAAEIYR